MADLTTPEVRQVVFPVAMWPYVEAFANVLGMVLAQIPPDQIPDDETPTYVLRPIAPAAQPSWTDTSSLAYHSRLCLTCPYETSHWTEPAMADKQISEHITAAHPETSR